MKSIRPQINALFQSKELFIAALAVTALFYLGRLIHLGADYTTDYEYSRDGVLYSDEGWYANNAISWYLTGDWHREGELNFAVNLPVLQWLHTISFAIFGVSIIGARMTIVVCLGIACALLERERSGRGQVVDAAMVDGAASLTAMFHMFRNMGVWNEERGTNLLDTGAHFYDVYETRDGQWVSIGSIEPQFYAELLEKTGLTGEDLPAQMDRARWPEMKERVAAVIRTRTRAEWCEAMEGSDVCFAPVLSMSEAIEHPANRARSVFVEVAGATQPGPAPRFGRTQPEIQGPPAHAGQHTDAVLSDWGFSDEERRKLREAGAIR